LKRNKICCGCDSLLLQRERWKLRNVGKDERVDKKRAYRKAMETGKEGKIAKGGMGEEENEKMEGDEKVGDGGVSEMRGEKVTKSEV
jgi:uncharacterized protein YaiL (DUF2058 family)